MATQDSTAAFSDRHAVTKRLQSELMALMMAKNDLISAFPSGDDLFSWTGTIKGTPGTEYEGCSYKINLKFGGEYPYSAPKVTFSTPIFHPNVDQYGNICLDILKEKWSPSYSVSTLLVSLQSLLSDPNNDSPLNQYAAQLWGQPEYRSVVLKKFAEVST